MGVVAGIVVVASLVVDVNSLHAYSSMQAPAFRMLGDMVRTTSDAEAAARPVLATHRRYEDSLRRPIQWMNGLRGFKHRLAAPAKHEWLQLVRYWNEGGRDEVWFVADPARSDLALIKAGPPRAQYRWPFDVGNLLGGVRPNEMDWYAINPPEWYLGEGWALTPETAGVAAQDRRGPGYGDTRAWVRRRPGTTNIMVGGRNVASGAAAHLRIAIDGKDLDELTIGPGSFLRIWSLPLSPGAGDYATISISADTTSLSIEQFDARPSTDLIFGFGSGWHESELDPSTGVMWRWASERAVLQLRSSGQSAQLSIRGRLEAASSSRITVRAGDQLVTAFDVGRAFDRTVAIPASLLTGSEQTVIIESSAWYVPAERRWRSADRRRLALKLVDCRLTPAS
jgi:hypothetical protein